MKKQEKLTVENGNATVKAKKTRRMAICYDFDHTLSPDDMQTFSLIPSFGIDSEEFWSEANDLAINHIMDKNLAWMFELVKYSKFKEKSLRREYFKQVGAEVPLYEGVEEWFDLVNAYAAKFDIEVEHYIISSGLKEIIEGNVIAKHMKYIYASSYLYSADGIAEWPAQSVNYTTKTQFLFRIAKGILEEYDERVNNSMSRSELRIPYENIVYIGDSATDIPCMHLIRNKGGYSIGVFDPETGNKSRVYQLFNDGRLSFYAPACYTEDSPIYRYMTQIVDEIAARETQKEEQAILQAPAEESQRTALIQKTLDSCRNELTKEEQDLLESILNQRIKKRVKKS